MTPKKLRLLLGDVVVSVVVGAVFLVPFVFMVLTASKGRQEASLFRFTWPTEFLLQNVREVLQFADYRTLRALLNSTLLTVGSIVLILLLVGGIAYVLQRRNDRAAVSVVMLSGPILPPSVVPTIFVLERIGLEHEDRPHPRRGRALASLRRTDHARLYGVGPVRARRGGDHRRGL